MLTVEENGSWIHIECLIVIFFFFTDIHVEYVSWWQGCAPVSPKAPGTLFLILGN